MERVWRGDRERPKEERIDQAERGGAGANGNGQRQHGGDGRRRGLAQLAPAEHQIGAQRIQPADETLIQAGFALAQR